MSMLSLTERCAEILTMLTHKVRLLTLPQIARTWWAGTQRPAANAAQRLKSLERAGLVARHTLLSHPELQLSTPVFSWQGEGIAPDFGPVAYQLQARWREPVIPTQVVIATAEARRRLGGYLGGRKPRASEVTHDVHLAQVYLWHSMHCPRLAEHWVSESQQFAEGGGRKGRYPDAVIREDGKAALFIEFGGSYSKAKLQSFHERTRHVPYQIW